MATTTQPTLQQINKAKFFKKVEPITVTIYENIKEGDFFNVPKKSNRKETKRVRAKEFNLWHSDYSEHSGLIFMPAYMENGTLHTISERDILNINQHLTTRTIKIKPKLYKATGRNPEGWGEEEFFQWIAEYEGKEARVSRIFSYRPLEDGTYTEWYQNKDYSTLPKSTRELVLTNN